MTPDEYHMTPDEHHMTPRKHDVTEKQGTMSTARDFFQWYQICFLTGSK